MHLQFSLRNVLWAMFWFSVSGGAYAFLRLLAASPNLPPQGVPTLVAELILWLPCFLFAWSPVVAVSTLAGRTKTAIKVGAVLAPPSFAVVCIVMGLGVN
jgi:hypothetical protein